MSNIFFRFVPAPLLGLLALLGTGLATPAHAAPNVVASIAPIGSLVAAVMEGVGTPYILIKGGASPHTYSLKPSDAEALQNAQLAVWVGPELEPFLIEPLKSVASQAKRIELDTLPDLLRLPLREAGLFTQTEGQADWKAPEPFNMHLWLDPENAKFIAQAVAARLGEMDPGNAARYMANLSTLKDRLDALQKQIAAELAPVSDKPFIVFHDAYAYFENRFGVRAAGSITVSPEVIPGAARLAQLRQAVTDHQAVCVFAEPEFTPRQIAVLTEGTGVKSGILDPLGANLEPGPDLYFNLIEGMAKSMADCLR